MGHPWWLQLRGKRCRYATEATDEQTDRQTNTWTADFLEQLVATMHALWRPVALRNPTSNNILNGLLATGPAAFCGVKYVLLGMGVSTTR